MNQFTLVYISGLRQLLKVCLVIFVSTFFILFFLQPFGDIVHGYTGYGILRIVSYAAVASSVVFLAECWLAPWYRFRIAWAQTRFGPLIWYGLMVLLVAIGIYFCRWAWMGWGPLSISDMGTILYRVIIIAALPFSFITLLLIAGKKEETPTSIILVSDEVNSEQFKINVDEVFYLSSEENYTALFLGEKGGPNKKLLRGSLSFFEQQLTFPMVRIHRSRMINVNKVREVKYNSRGGKIYLVSIDEPFTISKKYRTHFQNAWSRLQ